MGDQHLGLQARLMSQAMRKIAGIAFQTGTLVVFINQLRHKIGVTFGSPEVTTGGNALKYFASVRLDIRRISTVRDGEDAVASRCRVKVAKNKCAPPFTEAQFEIAFGTGIDCNAEVLDWAGGQRHHQGGQAGSPSARPASARAELPRSSWSRTHQGERDALLARAMTDLSVRSPGAADDEEARAA